MIDCGESIERSTTYTKNLGTLEIPLNRGNTSNDLDAMENVIHMDIALETHSVLQIS